MAMVIRQASRGPDGPAPFASAMMFLRLLRFPELSEGLGQLNTAGK